MDKQTDNNARPRIIKCINPRPCPSYKHIILAIQDGFMEVICDLCYWRQSFPIMIRGKLSDIDMGGNN